MSPIDNPDKGGHNILVRLWRGHLSLVISYWVFGVLGGFIWAIAFELWEPRKRVGTFLLLAGMVGYYVVVYAGIWRAADRYSGRKEWAFLAKCAVVLGIFSLIRNVSLLTQ